MFKPKQITLSYTEHLMGAVKYNKELLQKMASLKIQQSIYLLRKKVSCESGNSFKWVGSYSLCGLD